jgi:hypothetical protein
MDQGPPQSNHHTIHFRNGSYKSNYNGNSRTRLGRLGPTETIILEYALSVASSFAPSDVIAYLRSKYGTVMDRRRVHDAIQRLVKRGVLVKESRGWYSLSKSIDLTARDIKLKKARERVIESSPRKPKDSRWVTIAAKLIGVGVVEAGVVRVHSPCAGDVVQLFFQVAYSYYILGIVMRGLEEHMRVMGYSKHFVASVRAVARHMALSVTGCEAVVGAHGRIKGRSRPLLPLSYAEVIRLRELGVDLLAHVDLPKIHVKIYTDKSPYIQQAIPLITWAHR